MVAIDMEQPESCRQCEFETHGECFILTVWIGGKNLTAVDGMRDDCPLLEVPDEAEAAICKRWKENQKGEKDDSD